MNRPDESFLSTLIVGKSPDAEAFVDDQVSQWTQKFKKIYVETIDLKKGLGSTFFVITNIHHSMHVNLLQKNLGHSGYHQKVLLVIKNLHLLPGGTKSQEYLKIQELVDQGRKADFFVLVHTETAVGIDVDPKLLRRFPEMYVLNTSVQNSQALLGIPDASTLLPGKSFNRRHLPMGTPSSINIGPKECSCSSRDLFQLGCKCGAFQR